MESGQRNAGKGAPVRIFVPLTIEETDRLCAVAKQERRSPQDQAAVLIVEGLAARDGEHAAQRAPAQEKARTAERQAAA